MEFCVGLRYWDFFLMDFMQEVLLLDLYFRKVVSCVEMGLMMLWSFKFFFGNRQGKEIR